MMPINPIETARPVLVENNKFLREVYTFDLHYLQAVWKMCRHCRQDSPQLLVSAVKVATQVTKQIFFLVFIFSSHNIFSRAERIYRILD